MKSLSHLLRIALFGGASMFLLGLAWFPALVLGIAFDGVDWLLRYQHTFTKSQPLDALPRAVLTFLGSAALLFFLSGAGFLGLTAVALWPTAAIAGLAVAVLALGTNQLTD